MPILELLVGVGLSVGKSLVEGWLKTTIEDTTFETASTSMLGELTKQLQKKTGDLLTSRSAVSQIDQIATQIARSLEQMVSAETKVDEGGKEAVIRAVGQSIHRVQAADLFAGRLEPSLIADRFRSSNTKQLTGFNELEKALYERLLFEAATILVKMANKIPSFDVTAFKTVIDELTSLQSMVQEVLEELQKSSRVTMNEGQRDHDFTRKYLLEVEAKLNQMDHLGLQTISNAVQKCPLDVAYIKVMCDGEDVRRHRDTLKFQARVKDFKDRLGALPYQPPHDPEDDIMLDIDEINSVRNIASNAFASGAHTKPEPISADEIAAEFPFILIRGQAGSGKTTVLRWMAVQMAKGQFQFKLKKGLNNALPFYIRLRDFTGKPLPTPEDFLYFAAPNLAGTMPYGWVHRQLEKIGGSVILIDGIDELTADKREQIKEWITGLQSSFQNTRMIVTSRPSAVSSGWLAEEKFVSTEVRPLEPEVIPEFVRSWHDAVKIRLSDQAEKNALDVLSANLPDRIVGSASYMDLAKTPLLLGALCALNRDRNKVLPENRIELYQVLIEMLIRRRDSERGIEGEYQVDSSVQQLVLQRIAYWMVSNELPSAPKQDILRQIAREQLANVSATPAQVLQVLIERSGILREPVVDEIDFSHLTIQEFLAAEEAVSRVEIQPLLDKSEGHERWERVIQFAGGISGKSNLKYQLKLIEGLRKLERPFLALECVRTLIGGESLDETKRCVEQAVSMMSTMADAETISGVQNVALEYLAFDGSDRGWHLRNRILVLSMIGNEAAYEVLKSYRGCNQESVVNAITDLAAPIFGQKRVIQELLQPLALQSLSVYWRTVEGLQELTELKNLSIGESFQGLEHLTQLQTLQISAIRVENLNFLEHLTKLQSFTFFGGQEVDLTSLKHLTNLQSLSLGGILINDLNFLEHFSQLQNLTLSNVKMNDFSVLGNLTQLQSLNLYGVQDADFSFLENLTQLQDLGLSGVQEIDIALLKHFTKLQSLALVGGRADNLNFLKNFTHLKSLRLNGVQVNDMDFLKHLTHLQDLDLSRVWVKDWSFLKDLPQLQSLNISDIKERDLAVLEHLTQLRSLIVNEVREKDLPFLKHLTQLETLYISSIEVNDWAFLAHYANLQNLGVEGTHMPTAKVLNSLPHLQNFSRFGMR
jgi:NACHT domain